MLATDLRVHVEHGAARQLPPHMDMHRGHVVYLKHFVWNALPEERAAGGLPRQSVGAAWSS
eukprot:780435-Prymnesium_polylepis.1